jgi:hypothetical protein
VLEKYQVFNKQVTKGEYEKIKEKIQSHLPYYLHPKNLTKDDIAWLKKNIKQFDQKVLNRIIETSELPDNPIKVSR